jgi:hypothetical protein
MVAVGHPVSADRHGTSPRGVAFGAAIYIRVSCQRPTTFAFIEDLFFEAGGQPRFRPHHLRGSAFVSPNARNVARTKGNDLSSS